jgi:exopolyphosphatase/guanosine-5'-triphosphate,3'-diphosphate pyrophosphatase
MTKSSSGIHGAVRRAAAIDIGTNSVLLLIAETRGERVEALVERATITRLGQNVDRTRRLSPEACTRTLNCLEQYAHILEQMHVERVAVVGTSAMRDAEGGEDFLSDAERVVGTRPRVIDGTEEAHLSYAGALSGLAVSGNVVVCDIGGGSTEIITGSVSGTQRQVSSAVSLDIGSVRLFERHVKSDPPTADQLAAARVDIQSALDGVQRPAPGTTLVGVAGTITTLAALEQGLVHYDPALVHGARLERTTIQRLLLRLRVLSVAQRKALPGLDPARADVIVTGAAIASELITWSGADELVVSDRGVRWGLILGMLAPETDTVEPEIS